MPIISSTGIRINNTDAEIINLIVENRFFNSLKKIFSAPSSLKIESGLDDLLKINPQGIVSGKLKDALDELQFKVFFNDQANYNNFLNTIREKILNNTAKYYDFNNNKTKASEIIKLIKIELIELKGTGRGITDENIKNALNRFSKFDVPDIIHNNYGKILGGGTVVSGGTGAYLSSNNQDPKNNMLPSDNDVNIGNILPLALGGLGLVGAGYGTYNLIKKRKYPLG